jgi:hypothetical protein
MVFIRTLAAATLRIVRIQRPQFSATVLSGRLVGQASGFTYRQMRREEKREANDYGNESIEIELRDDKALVPYVAWLPMPGSQSRVQSGSSQNQH